MQRWARRILGVLVLGLALAGCDSDRPPKVVTFDLRIEVIGRGLSLSPGVWVVHADSTPLFAQGASDRGQGLKLLIDQGDPSDLDRSLADDDESFSSGRLEIDPDGSGAVLTAGFRARRSAGRLSFATKLSPFEALFVAPDEHGIELFDGPEPIEGDLTAEVRSWELGASDSVRPGRVKLEDALRFSLTPRPPVP